GGEWAAPGAGGAPLVSLDPATGREVWRGRGATAADVDRAMRAARAAFAGWSRAPHDERERTLRAFAAALEADAEGLAAAISLETGKPPWEARAEARSMVAKVEISIR